MNHIPAVFSRTKIDSQWWHKSTPPTHPVANQPDTRNISSILPFGKPRTPFR